ncbi:MAG: hypothetical protein HKN28_02635 [Alphaproteobacteria bacterium]|nr:hypothetical protein [Alphaproteobacteria bacterium]
MRFSLIIAAALLAACQPLPKPFSHDGAPPSDLLRLTDGQGITVLPVTDRGGTPLELLTRDMVRALHAQNVPATYGGTGRSSYLLLGHFSTPPAPPALIWTLRTQQGDEVGTVVQSLRNAAGQPAKLDSHTAFARSAGDIAALIRDEPPAEAVPPPLHVGDVAGAPGDGNSRLRAAIEQLLPRTGLELAPEAAADSLIVTGTVTVGGVRGGEQIVDIAWTVWDPFGVEVGTIAQARPVPVGSLDGNWGLIANEAALAGAVGIAEMVRQIDWSQGIQPPPG